MRIQRTRTRIWLTALNDWEPPQTVVAPFALLAPCVGALSSAIVFGERFGPLRLAGIAAILFGLAIVLFPLDRIAAFRMRRFRSGRL